MERSLAFMKHVTGLAVIVLVSCQPHLAQANSGPLICRSSHSVAAKNVERSLKLQDELADFFEKRLNNDFSLRQSMTTRLLHDISDRETVSDPEGTPGINLSKLFKVPTLKPETMEALKAYHQGLSENEVKRSELREATLTAADHDPYFQWLQKNQADDTLGLPDASNVVDYLFALIEMPGPGALPPDLAFLHVYRDAHPYVTSGQVRHIDDVLQLRRNELVLHDIVQSLRRPQETGRIGLAPSLAEARENLHRILDQNVKRHGIRFSKKSYEIASKYLAHRSPEIRVIDDMKPGMDWNRLPKDISLRWDILKMDLGLPQQFSSQELHRLMSVLRESNRISDDSAYPLFLLNAFEDSATSSELNQVRHLKNMIELMEAKESIESKIDPSAFRDLLQKRIDRLFRYWENP